MQKRLLPFLENHKGSTLFWPDLATTHYSKFTIEWYSQHKVNFIPNDFNPPNCPELRHIERYWALITQKLRQDRGEVKTVEELKSNWRK